MSRRVLARVLGAEAALGAVLVMLAGSDWPPPVGFWLVGLSAIGLGLLMGFLVPVVLRRADRSGALPALLITAVGGAGYLGAMALILMLVSTGEPSVRVGAPERLVFLLAAACVGWIGGAAYGAVALLADRLRDQPARLRALILALPALVFALVVSVALTR